MDLEHAIDGTVSSHSVLEPWEILALWIVVGYAIVAALRLATRPRRLPLLSTRLSQSQLTRWQSELTLPQIPGLSDKVPRLCEKVR